MKTLLKDYIKSVKWQKAKDGMHEYTVLAWKPELENEFREFVRTIYEKGFKGNFHGTTYTYLKIDDHVYWTMNSRVEVTVLINRKMDESFLS